METHRYDTNSKSLSSMSSSSGVSSHTCKALNVMPAESFEVCASQITCTPDETHQESHPELQETNVMNADFGEDDGALAEQKLVITDKEFCENGDGDDVANNASKVEISESPAHVRSTSELGALPVTDDHSRLQEKGGNESPQHGLSTMTASEIELESCAAEKHGIGVHDEILESECNLNAVEDCSEKSMGHDYSLDHNSLAPVNEILDESTVIVECPGGKETKSLTLEEATDTILFCSSIVHDLVYEAATIAMEKAKDVAAEEEMLHPTVTVLGKSNPNRSSNYGRTKEKKKQSSKARRKQRETEAKTEVDIENDENASEAAAMMSNVGVPPPPSKGESLKPPPKLENKCNCSIM